MRPRLPATLRTPRGPDWPLVALLLSIHAIALFNALAHDPFIGYDAGHHLGYVDALSQLRLPTREDSEEFFSPPLPYLIPAAARWMGASLRAAGKVGQIGNVIVSLGLCLQLLGICERMRPGDRRLRFVSLALLGSLPVHYKTFAFVRGEPLLAFLAVLVAGHVWDLLARDRPSGRQVALLGAGLGLALLARQWGALLFPAVGALALIVCFRPGPHRLRRAGAVACAFAIAAAIGGWYYVHLHRQFGSMAAFNRSGWKSFSFSNQPASFYFGLGDGALFVDPIRSSFPNQLLPILHSETWGDYWAYFLVYGRDTRNGRVMDGLVLDRALAGGARPEWLQTNRFRIAAYLGRVNLVSLLPSAALAAGALLGATALGRMLVGRGAVEREGLAAMHFLVIAFTAAGYLYFLISFPSHSTGRTIKASYVLQICPALCILAGEAIVRLRRTSVKAYRALVALLAVCALHNLPALFSRMTSW